MNKDHFLEVLRIYADGNDFMLNPDEAHLNSVVDGVLANKEKCGLKLCPCRIRDGSKERDLELLCPCNFKIQETWGKFGRCWCGLFVKKED